MCKSGNQTKPRSEHGRISAKFRRESRGLTLVPGDGWPDVFRYVQEDACHLWIEGSAGVSSGRCSTCRRSRGRLRAQFEWGFALVIPCEEYDDRSSASKTKSAGDRNRTAPLARASPHGFS